MQRLWVALCFLLIVPAAAAIAKRLPLRFSPDGRFKILQVADMHYANGGSTKCRDVLPHEHAACSDLNTTAFVRRLIAVEAPDLIVFSGDNIFGQDAADPVASLNAAFAPAVEARIPWAAILGNHDQESTLSRREVMKHIVKLDHTLSQVNPTEMGGAEAVDGFGNYHLEVMGAMGSPFETKSVLNLYMLDSGDYSKLHKVHGYGWIQESQKKWFKELSERLKDDFRKDRAFPNETAQALVYFHIPLVEARHVARRCSITGVRQEAIGCAQVNSGFLDTMLEAGDPRAVFNGHDHVNDFCGDLLPPPAAGDIKMCYGGGVGYHAYGRAGWSRRARVVEVSLHLWNRTSDRSNESELLSEDRRQWWLGVERISTWKRLDRPSLPIIDREVLWSRTSVSSRGDRGWNLKASSLLTVTILIYLILCFMFSSWRPFKCALDARAAWRSPWQRRPYGYSLCET